MLRSAELNRFHEELSLCNVRALSFIFNVRALSFLFKCPSSQISLFNVR